MMKWLINLIITLAFVATLPACTYLMSTKATTNAAMLDPAVRYPPSVSVELLETQPQAPHKKIARLETIGSENITSEIFLIENMRSKAKEIGADAIIVPYGRTRKFSQEEAYWVLTGDAIRYPKPEDPKTKLK